MITDMLFRQIQDLKRNLTALELSIGEINNAIFMLEERMYDLDDCKTALHGFDDEY